jgi:2,5-diketo-D-gluconate reductase A
VIPQLGFGVWQVPAEQTADVVEQALAAGYRHTDTAKGYGNESGVGEALRRSGLPRDEVFVTSKLPNQDQGYEAALASFDTTMDALGLEYLDLYLIHWPVPAQGLAVDSWRAFVKLQEEGRIRSIGVSNFRIEDLQAVEEATGVRPAINQIELHPAYPQTAAVGGTLDWNLDHGITVEAWSPLGRGAALDAEPVTAAAEAHGVTAGQVVLAWHRARGVTAIPKAAHRNRQRENLASLSVTLSDAEVEAITALGRPDGRLKGQDPATYEEF